MRRVLGILLLATSADAAVEIDLAVTPADWTAWGAGIGFLRDSLGERVAVADINGDGAPDLLVTREGAWPDGQVCSYFGPFSLPEEHDMATEEPPMCILGEGDVSLALNGDVLHVADLDGDGIDDLLVGAQGGENAAEAGVVGIFLGRRDWPSTVDFPDADWLFHGIDRLDWMYSSVVGDLNGDDHADLVLFAGGGNGPGESRGAAGEGYIFFGPTSSWTKKVFNLRFDPPDVMLYGAQELDHFGLFGRAVVADVLGDSLPDLVVGAGDADGPDDTRNGAGAVYLFRGRRSWPAVVDAATPGTTDLVIHGAHDGAQLGIRQPAVADVDNDGVPDLVIGNDKVSVAGRVVAGAVHVFRGGALGGTWDLAVRPADAMIIGGDRTAFGSRVAAADVNGDSYLDLVAAGPGVQGVSGSWRGGIHVFSGCDGPLASLRDLALEPSEMTIDGIDAGDSFGLWGLAAGDIDGDGRADLFGGTPITPSLDNARNPWTGEVHLVLGRPFDTSCTIAADAGPDVEVCGEADVPLDGSATVVTDCAVTPQYRWMDGETVLTDWSGDPTVTVRPTGTATYRLEVRCGDCDGPCFETADVIVTVDADVLPPGLGNTLMAVRRDLDVVLEWTGIPEASTYALPRSEVLGVWVPFLEGLSDPAITLPSEVPAPPALYFYRVAGESCSGRDGP